MNVSDIDDCAESVKRLTSDRGEVMRAGNDKIEAIRARHAVYPPRPGAPHGFFIAHQDIATLLAEDERHRAENERLRNEDTKTRHALKGWVFVCPDGGDEPTHERVSAVVAEVEKQRAEIERLRADNERMHNVLYRIARKRPFVHNPWALARAALEGEP